MKIMPNRLDKGFYMYQQEFEEKALKVLRSGWYVLGEEVRSFEEEFAAPGKPVHESHEELVAGGGDRLSRSCGGG